MTKLLFETLPRISVITVVFNGEKTLEKTIQSVIGQTYPNIEYIIIDGGSTDNTLNIIEKYEKHIDHWISEPDKGIYDAMNKGISLANGQWINFMGSDDLYYSPYIIEKIFTTLTISKYDFIYGNVYMKPTRNKIHDNKFYSYKLVFKNICHQAIFYRKNLFELYGKYNLRYKIWADYEFNMRIFKRVRKKYIDLIVAFFNDTGYSSHYEDQVFLIDRERLLKKYLGYHYYLLFKMREIYKNFSKTTRLFLR